MRRRAPRSILKAGSRPQAGKTNRAAKRSTALRLSPATWFCSAAVAKVAEVAITKDARRGELQLRSTSAPRILKNTHRLPRKSRTKIFLFSSRACLVLGLRAYGWGQKTLSVGFGPAATFRIWAKPRTAPLL